METSDKKLSGRIVSLDVCEAVRMLLGSEHDETLEARYEFALGESFGRTHRKEEAIELLDRAKRLFADRAMEADVARCHLEMGVIYDSEGDHERAIGHYESARHIFDLLGMQEETREAGHYCQAAECLIRQKYRSDENAEFRQPPSADEIKAWRLSQDLSLERAARKLGSPSKNVDRWERKLVVPSGKYAEALRFLMDGGRGWNAATQTREFVEMAGRGLRQEIDSIIEHRGSRFLEGGYKENSENLESLKRQFGDNFTLSSDTGLKGEIKDMMEESATLATLAGFCVGMLKYARYEGECDKWAGGARAAFYDLAALNTMLAHKSRKGIDERFWGHVFSEHFSHGYATAVESHLVSLLDEITVIRDALEGLKGS